MTESKTHSRPSKPFTSWRGSHVGIRVADFDAAVDWYIAMLEFRLTETMQHGSTRFGVLTLPTDDAFAIEIIANPNGAPRPPTATCPTAML
ncbi:VOC family protein [Rhizobium sp. G21]|uniref:VOC family protein n=1 Tax=Rhizobium sp. G21 TaxID=2758439 RepID=UPI003917C1F4